MTACPGPSDLAREFDREYDAKRSVREFRLTRLVPVTGKLPLNSVGKTALELS